MEKDKVSEGVVEATALVFAGGLLYTVWRLMVGEAAPDKKGGIVPVTPPRVVPGGPVYPNPPYSIQPGEPGAVQGVDIPVVETSAEWGLYQQTGGGVAPVPYSPRIEPGGPVYMNPPYSIQPGPVGGVQGVDIPVVETSAEWGLYQQTGAGVAPAPYSPPTFVVVPSSAEWGLSQQISR